jgi:hypothetical protein
MRDIWNPKYEWTQNPKYISKEILNLKETGVILNNTIGADIQINIPSDNILDLYIKGDEIYIATSAGIYIFNKLLNSGTTIDTTYIPLEGSGLTSNDIFAISIDEYNNILYATTADGIWKWNMTIDKGWIINENYIPTTGNSPPSGFTYNVCNINYYRNSLNHVIFYFGYQALGFWEWNTTIDSGKLVNTSTSVIYGVNLPSDTIYQIVINKRLEILYVATPLGIWRWKRSNNEGFLYDSLFTPSSGDQYPTGTTRTVYFDNINEIMYAGLLDNGIYQYDTTYDVGDHLSAAIPFTTNGVEIPNDPVLKIYKNEIKNKLYVSSTTNGIWSYNLVNGEGKIFNNISGVTYGNNLPSNNLSIITTFDEYELLYIGNQFGLWKFNYEVEYYDTLIGGEITRIDREQLWNVDDLTDVYFRLQKCISGISFTYVDNLSDVYRFGVLTNDDSNSLFNMYNEYEIMNKFIKNYIQVDVASVGNIDLTQPQFKIDDVVLKQNHLVLLKDQTNIFENDIYIVNEKRFFLLSNYLSDREKSDRFKAYVKLGTINKNKQFFLLPNSYDIFPISGEQKVFDVRHSYILKHRIVYDINTIPTNTGNTHKLVFADYDVARLMNNKNFELYSGFIMTLNTLNTGYTFDLNRYNKTYSIQFSDTYNPFDDYLKRTSDSIPPMTSNVSISGSCSANGSFYSGFETWKAFDDNNTTFWRSNTSNGWLKFNYNTPIIIWKYSIECTDDESKSPKNWKFQASNNDIDWINLDVQMSQVAWSTRSYREFIINNTVPYLFYRLYVTTNNGSTLLSISEMQLFDMIYVAGSITYEPYTVDTIKNFLITDPYSKKYNTIVDNSVFPTIPINIDDYIRIEIKREEKLLLMFDTFVTDITSSGLTISDLMPEWIIKDFNNQLNITWIIRNIQYSDLSSEGLVVSLQNSFLSKFFSVNDISTMTETKILFQPTEYEYNIKFDYDGLEFVYSGSTSKFTTQNSYIRYKLYEFLSGVTSIVFKPDMILYNDDEITSFSQFYLDKDIIQLNITNIDDLVNFNPYTYVEISGTTTYTKTLILKIDENIVWLEKPKYFLSLETVVKIKNIKELLSISEILYDVYKNEDYDYYISKNDFVKKNIYLYYGEIMNNNDYIKFYTLGLLSESKPNTRNFILRFYKIEDDVNLFYRPIEILDVGVDKKTMIPKQLLYPEYFNQTERIDDFYLGEYNVLDGNAFLVFLVVDPNESTDYVVDSNEVEL